MIGGKTSFDCNPAALLAILRECSSVDDYATRIGKIRGTTGGGLNGTNYLNSSAVPDDGAADMLTGAAGLDWFRANQAQDTITDLLAEEIGN